MCLTSWKTKTKVASLTLPWTRTPSATWHGPKKTSAKMPRPLWPLFACPGSRKTRSTGRLPSGRLKLFADKYADYGYFSSSYARAVEAGRAPGLHVTIVGDRSDDRDAGIAAGGVELCRAGEDGGNADAGRSRPSAGCLPIRMGRPYATVCVGTVCFAPVTEAEEMRRQMRSALCRYRSEADRAGVNSSRCKGEARLRRRGRNAHNHRCLRPHVPIGAEEFAPSQLGAHPVVRSFPLLLSLLTLPLHAQTLPHFRTAADARAWGEARERAQQYEAAAQAYEVGGRHPAADGRPAGGGNRAPAGAAAQNGCGAGRDGTGSVATRQAGQTGTGRGVLFGGAGRLRGRR